MKNTVSQTLLQTSKTVVDISIPKDVWENIKPLAGSILPLEKGMKAKVLATGYDEDLGVAHIALERL